MIKKTEAELEKSRIIKTARSIIRLKHSLAADEEINDILPDTLAQFDDALARGELKELKVDLAGVLSASGD